MESISFSINGPKGSNDDRMVAPFEVNEMIFAAIADGVGGVDRGSLAAEIATETARGLISESPSISFEKIFNVACEKMLELTEGDSPLSGMATTFSCLRVRNGIASVGHVGDSRIYHIRGRGLITRTRDQTEVAELLRQKVLTKAQAVKYARKNVLLSYLGPEKKFELYEREFEVEDGDVLLLLTDGVYNDIRKSELIGLLNNTNDLNVLSIALQEKLNDAGPRDDATLIAIKI